MYENKEYYINCDGIDIHVKLDFPLVQPEKMHVLIIIPGLTGHIEERHIVAVRDTALMCGYAVLRSELYGHGKSGGEFRDHTVLMWMHEAMRVTDHALSLPFCKDVIVSGHSQGGLTAVLASGLMYDRVKAAMPMSPAINIWDGAVRGEYFGQKLDPDHLPENLPCVAELNGNYLRAAALLPVREAIRRFTKPVFIIHGTKDGTVPYRYSRWLQKRYENAELVPVTGDDHCYNFHLDRVLSAVRDFLTAQAEL